MQLRASVRTFWVCDHEPSRGGPDRLAAVTAFLSELGPGRVIAVVPWGDSGQSLAVFFWEEAGS